MRKIPWQLWVWSAFAAVLQVLPFPLAGPVPVWRRELCWFCMVPLLYALLSVDRHGKSLTGKQSVVLSYFCGILWYLGNCYWIYPTMRLYGAQPNETMPKPIAAGILVLFALYLGLYFALFGFLVGWMRTYASRNVLLFSVPFLWVAVELARARITGFPWDLLGYTQVDNVGFARLASVTGVMGLSFLIALVNSLWLVRGTGRIPKWIGPIGAMVLVLIVLAIPAGPKIDMATGAPSAVLLQENLAVGVEASGPHESRDQLLASLSRISQDAATKTYVSGAPASLILWPEAPADFFDSDPVFRQTLGTLARQVHAPLIADSIAVLPPDRLDGPNRLYNSASFFTPEGQYAGRYDKIHLVPFGEYTPYKQIFFFAGHLLDNVGGFVPGTERTLLQTGGHRYGVFICYESIFGDEVRQFVNNGADVLINLSDDGWYGDSSAPWEHLDMARMRAIENNRWVLRSTNTGITTVIDPAGRTREQLPRHERAALVASFGYVSGTTFYTRHGDWLAWVCVLITAALVAFGWRKRGEVHWRRYVK